MATVARSTAGHRAMFSVFSDENETRPVTSSKNTTKSRRSVLSSSTRSNGTTQPVLGLKVPSKRAKMDISTGCAVASSNSAGAVYSSRASSSHETMEPKKSTRMSTLEPASHESALSTRGRPSAAASFAVFSDDKENIDPLGRRKASTKSGKSISNVSKGASSAPAAQNASSSSSSSSLWNGKQPFDFASPEKEGLQTTTKNSTASSSKYIYDLPGLQARQLTSARSLCAPSTSSYKPALASNQAVSKPNKKPKTIPAPLKKTSAFQIFRDEQPAATSSLAAHQKQCDDIGYRGEQAQGMSSPVLSVSADRRARELTESPLADVSQAYLGRGRFSNSPTADSGFGSREHSVSPLPSARSFTASSSHDDQTSQRGALTAEGLPKALERLSLLNNPSSSSSSSPKRRISQVSNVSFDAMRSTSSSLAASSTTMDLEVEQFGDELLDLERSVDLLEGGGYDRINSDNEDGSDSDSTDDESEPSSKHHSLSVEAALGKEHSSAAITDETVFKAPRPPGFAVPNQASRPMTVSNGFGARISVPTRKSKPLNMRI